MSALRSPSGFWYCRPQYPFELTMGVRIGRHYALVFHLLYFSFFININFPIL